MVSKNFYWWLVALFSFVGVLVNVFFDMWFVAVVCGVCFVLSANKYLLYRSGGN